MKLIDKKITIQLLQQMAQRAFGGLVKAIVHIKKKVMVIDADMHADEEKYLLETGSKQDDLWGINLYPELTGNDFIEFDSMINLRPRLNNFSRGIENISVREKIIKIVNKLVQK